MNTWDISDGKCLEVVKSIYIHTNIQVSNYFFITQILFIDFIFILLTGLPYGWY